MYDRINSLALCYIEWSDKEMHSMVSLVILLSKHDKRSYTILFVTKDAI